MSNRNALGFPRGFSCLMTAALLGVLSTNVVRAEVVFGNLGAAGTDSLSATNTDYGGGLVSDPVVSLAQGFTTSSGTANKLVDSVTLGLFSSDSPSARTVSIYPNIGSGTSARPGASPLYTSASQNVTGVGSYTFSFTNALLSPSTPYWIVPSGPASWYLNLDESNPTDQNGSGWAYLATRRITNTSGGNWVNSSQPYSVSIAAVPEPSTYAMALAGLACAGASMRWKRRSRA